MQHPILQGRPIQCCTPGLDVDITDEDATREWTRQREEEAHQVLVERVWGPLADAPAMGRQVLRKLLPEPITLTPEVGGQSRLVAWDYRGGGVLDQVIAGRVPVASVSKANTTGMVPKGGLEPPRVAPHAPQTCASASSATSADVSDRSEVYRQRPRVTNRPVACRRRGSSASRMPSPSRL
jgi:hypothetical protein